MTETSADWVERPKPANVAARTTRPEPPARPRRERSAEWPSAAVDPRRAGGIAAALALVAALIIGRRSRRRR